MDVRWQAVRCPRIRPDVMVHPQKQAYTACLTLEVCDGWSRSLILGENLTLCIVSVLKASEQILVFFNFLAALEKANYRDFDAMVFFFMSQLLIEFSS